MREAHAPMSQAPRSSSRGPSDPKLPGNVFAPALAPESDGGPRLTEAEFSVTVYELSIQQGGITGRLVERVRQDWEALARSGAHPATEGAQTAYFQFVKEFGLLPLIEALYPRAVQ